MMRDDADFETFLEHLRRPLPTTFRITGHSANTALVKEQLIKEHVETIRASNASIAPEPIPWYPYELAWQLEVERAVMRKDPALGAFYRWLVAAAENGDVTRQESVSMIPPLLLDIEPHHLVLDVCAAPGSKTSQLLERLHEKCSAGSMPSGAIVANDVNKDRAYMLFHQVKRFDSPALVVVNHDGTFFPNIFAAEEKPVEFDRILADVPCSGDGTMRKNIDIWRSWSPRSGIGLNPIQIRILERCLLMLKVGGRVVYSTCSFNPAENEAVIAHILRKHSGKVRIVDASSRLVGLRTRSGLKSWRIVDKDGREHFHPEHAPQGHCADPNYRVPVTAFYQPEYVGLDLEKCVRVLPQDQNSGGFFIALLEKTDELGGEQTRGRRRLDEPVAKDSTLLQDSEGPVQKMKRSRVQDEEPFSLLPHDSSIVGSIRDFFGISSEDLGRGAFLIRSTKDFPKNLYYVTAPIGHYVSGRNEGLRIINAGIKCLDLYDNKRTDYPCSYRLTMDALACFLPMMTKRVFEASASDLLCLLASEDSVQHSKLSEELRSRLDGIEAGSAVLKLASEKSTVSLALPIWVSGTASKVFVARPDRPKINAYLLQA
jgi:16S rRNA C967 or C1407 C5-methylase (RsmB/RsmF family)